MSNVQESDLLTVETEQAPAETEDNLLTEGSEESEATSVKEDGSKDRPGWMDQLSGDLKENKALYKFKSASDAVKSLVELEGKLGKSVTVSDEPTEEELSRLRTLLGVPDSPDGYTLKDVELPEGFKLTDGFVKDMANFAHENNLTVGQAKAYVKKMAAREHEAVRQVRQIIKEGRDKAETRLRQELGSDYDKHLKAANTLLKDYGDQELSGALKDSGFVNSPAMVRFLGKVGLAVSEAEAPRGTTPPRTPKPTGAFPGARQIAEERKSYYQD
ncbi:MAG: hypothetical protein ABIJ57_01250 [Pseudomonadota bacterium]